jgi:hypothetical protein
MNKVCIAIPTKSGNLYFELALRLMEWASQETIPVQIIYQPFCSPVDHARNDILRRFMKTDCTHLMMIDDDVVPPVDALERLLFHDKEIVAAVCPIIAPDKNGELSGSFNAYSYKDAEYIPILDISPELHQVAAVGTGCIMIKKKFLIDSNLKFMTLYDDRGLKWQGEDINFCSEAENLGVHSYADFKLKCKHIKACNLLELYDQAG